MEKINEIRTKCIDVFIDEQKKELEDMFSIIEKFKSGLINNLEKEYDYYPSRTENDKIERKLKKIESIIVDFKNQLNTELNILNIQNNVNPSQFNNYQVENNNALLGMLLGGMLGYFAGSSYNIQPNQNNYLNENENE